MSQFHHVGRTRTASPGVKHVAFDHKCQVIPETDCAELRKLLILCPTRAQSPPIVSPSSGFIARAISPQLVRAHSPGLRKASGPGNAPPHAPTSWRTRIASWGSVTGSTDASTINSDASLSSASAKPAQATCTSSADDGPRLVAPVAARGIPSPMMPFDDDESILVDTSPSHESIPDFDDVDAEFQHAISGAANNSRRSSVTVLHATSPSLSILQPPRSTSPFVHSFSSLGKQQTTTTSSGSRPKSCLLRYSTPQAPGPPSLAGDGMSPLRTTRSNDRDGCFAQRRRADGVPVVCPSPLSSPEDEQEADVWDAKTVASASQSAKHAKPASAITEKTKLSRWKRFRRAISEDSHSFEPEGAAGRNTPPERRLDDAAVKREVQAGRWPFEAPLNTECSCKNCQDKIEVGLASNYEPKWTRAARIRWLEGQEDAAARSNDGGGSSAAGTARSASRIAIQADEVAQLHNETVHPMTEAELAAADPTSPQTERGEPLTATAAEVIGSTGRSPNPTGLEEGDEALRREIMARRQKTARQSPVLRHGARSMMRQIEEAERREQEAARVRTQSREGHRRSASAPGTGSGRSSPASSASQGITPSTPDTASTSPQERHAGGDSYFDLPPAPPERVRSPLIPVEVACTSTSGSSNNTKPGYTRSLVADDATWSMTSVAQTLEALASPTASPQTSPYVEK